MAGDFEWLLAMNTAARRFGDGLKPELEALLSREHEPERAGAIPLPVRVVSAGPARQAASREEMDAAGIVRLEDRRAALLADRERSSGA